jgi:hypothetical protein
MPLQFKNPVQANGKTYPYVALNLSISPLINSDYVGGSVSMRMTPYLIAIDGSIELYNEGAKDLLYMDVFKVIDSGDLILGEAVEGIMTSIQKFIFDKNI